jgi:hypothetical protein
MLVLFERKIKIQTGVKSQTVNICTKENIIGRYEYRVRLHPPFFVEPDNLVEKRFGNIQEIVTYLQEQHNGTIEKSHSDSFPPYKNYAENRPKAGKPEISETLNQKHLTNNTKLQKPDERWGVSSDHIKPGESWVIGYSERGIMNALFYEIQNSRNPNKLLSELLSNAKFPCRGTIDKDVSSAEILIEQSFSNFGDADLVLLLVTGRHRISIFAEAKVKPSQSSKWTIEGEYEKFVKGVESRLSSSNLFAQLYHKLRMVNSLSNGGLSALQSGISFPECSSRPVRKIGYNPVVLKAIEKISQYLDDVYYLAVVPDSSSNLDDFFENRFKQRSFPNLPEWDVHSFGYIAWSDVMEFCVSRKLESTLRVFSFNEGQIF